jgi:hypothetical protein
MDELDKVLAADPEAEAQKAALEAEALAKAEKEKQQDIDPELQKEREHRKNIEVALQQTRDELKRLKEAKEAKPTEEEIPKIDMNDPGSKAWDKHINEKVNPVQAMMEKENQEVFDFTLKKWLDDKPALAADPSKMKEFINNYERIKVSTGRTREGVEQDLDKAYAVTYSDLLLGREREASLRKGEGLALFSDPGVSRGATGYFQEKETYNGKLQSLTAEDRAIISRMGYASVEEWAKDKEKYS